MLINFTKLPRLYINSFIKHNIKLDLIQSNYLIQVMRLNIKDKIRVFNGKEGEFLAEITEINNKKVDILIIEKLREQYNSPEIWLLFSPLKNHRTDFIIEKSTELGVTYIQPILFERSIVKDLNLEKAKLNMIQAAEQCERLDLPLIFPILKLKEFMKKESNKTLIFMNENENNKSFADLDRNKISFPIMILVGPEGGLSQSELEIVEQKGTSLHLGPRILRAETASIISVALVQSLLGDFALSPRLLK